MSQYKYVDPLERGYKKFKLTRKQHNALFKYRKLRWADKYEYYYNDTEIILHRFVNGYAVIILTVLFPVIVSLHGLGNVKELWKDLKDIYAQKETGSFSSDQIRKGSAKYEEVMEIINERRPD